MVRYQADPRFAAFCHKVGLPVAGEIEWQICGMPRDGIGSNLVIRTRLRLKPRPSLANEARDQVGWHWLALASARGKWSGRRESNISPQCCV
jgi:hypothetical protein